MFRLRQASLLQARSACQPDECRCCGKPCVGMTENIRNYLDIHAFKEKQAFEGVAQGMDSAAVFDSNTLAYPLIAVDK